MADWSVTPQVEVVASENELPAQIRDQIKAEKMEGKVPGLYSPDTKTVYLVASGLKDANDVVLTIAHEVAGHFGLREMLGNGYAPTMNRLYDGNKLVRERADAVRLLLKKFWLTWPRPELRRKSAMCSSVSTITSSVGWLTSFRRSKWTRLRTTRFARLLQTLVVM
jgi:hypothetical protein